MRISDWSSDVCSSDLGGGRARVSLRSVNHRLNVAFRSARGSDTGSGSRQCVVEEAQIMQVVRRSVTAQYEVDFRLEAVVQAGAECLESDRKSTRLNSSH